MGELSRILKMVFWASAASSRTEIPWVGGRYGKKMIAPPKGGAIANFENGLLGFGRVLEDGNSLGGRYGKNDSPF